MNRTLPAVLTKIVDEGPLAKTFRLELAEGSALDFSPGQSVSVAFPGEGPGGVFPISSSPLDAGYVEITLTPSCDFSRRLFALSGGQTLELAGPLGEWCYKDDIKHAVLLSAGAGVAPYRSIMRYVLQKGLPNRIALLHSEHVPERIIFRAELDEFAKRGISVTVTITGNPPELVEGPWDGPRGPITPELVRKTLEGLPDAVCYVSAQGEESTALRETLLKAGVDKRRILADGTCAAL